MPCELCRNSECSDEDVKLDVSTSGCLHGGGNHSDDSGMLFKPSARSSAQPSNRSVALARPSPSSLARVE